MCCPGFARTGAVSADLSWMPFCRRLGGIAEKNLVGPVQAQGAVGFFLAPAISRLRLFAPNRAAKILANFIAPGR